MTQVECLVWKCIVISKKVQLENDDQEYLEEEEDIYTQNIIVMVCFVHSIIILFNELINKTP